MGEPSIKVKGVEIIDYTGEKSDGRLLLQLDIEIKYIMPNELRNERIFVDFLRDISVYQLEELVGGIKKVQNNMIDRTEDVVPKLYTGAELRKMRKKLGLTLKNASSVIGISFQSLGDIERGDRNPSISALKKICKIYKCEFIIS